jgi:Fe-Mn family superoxide dismutase
MFEHCYHMDYGARAGEYVDAFLRNVSWDECNRGFETADNAYGALRA